MSVLVLGLVIFLGAHSVRIFAESWRTRQIARLGEKGWKGAYSVVSAVGLRWLPSFRTAQASVPSAPRRSMRSRGSCSTTGE
jgi:uncharacterized membrane protein